MDDTRELKDLWKQMNERLWALEQENKRMAFNIQRSNYKSAREKLITKYKRMIVIEIIILVVMSFRLFDSMVDERLRIPTLIYWIVFFLIEISIDIYLMQKTKEIDIYKDSIHEIAQKARRNWKIHKAAIFIGLPLAIGFIILYALSLHANIYIVYGIFAGAVLGLILGVSILRKFIKDYRDLQDEDFTTEISN